MSRKRVSGGLSKPNIFRMSATMCGSSPRAPRYDPEPPNSDVLPPKPRREIALALQLGDHLLDRTARRELDDNEIDGDDSEQRRDHQQQAADEIGGH